MDLSKTNVELVSQAYAKILKNLEVLRKRKNSPLTLAEKLLFGHAKDINSISLKKGEDFGDFLPDRVAMQDATAQMAILQFMQADLPKTAVPTTVHCDHLIQAYEGANNDLLVANKTHKEVFDFLRSSSQKYGIGFWGPGAGIIHQVVLEQYAFPGGMMIGTDSHTPNAGGIGMIAIGVGGADAVDVMAGMPFNTKIPKLIGVKLTGSLSGWTAPKDIILKVAETLTVKGGTNAIVEYFGEGTKTISTTGKATITNMGAEIGATCSVFPFDEKGKDYLIATDRRDLADLAIDNIDILTADKEVLESPEDFFDQVIEIDLSTLEPHIVGPHTPDLARPISKLKDDATKNSYPMEISSALIGSCTNSSYEDIGRAAYIAREAAKKGLKSKVPLMVTPGSEQTRVTIERDGYLKDLEAIGATVLANACGPCIGQWKRDDIKEGESNSIVSSYNRNFPARNDGNAETLSFIGSPESVIGLALGGSLDFDFLTETLTNDKGEKVKLTPPVADELPSEGFAQTLEGFIQPSNSNEEVEVIIDPNSTRLQILEPFQEFNENNYQSLTILMKAKGKCTTDHISPAGKWLQFRGHLENISQNLFIGVNNSYTDESGIGNNLLTNETMSLPDLAKSYHENSVNWVAIGDENYGEGSSREHAAMEPRFRGCKVVIVKSFARIHEANLKKQGILPLTFDNKEDYNLINQEDKLTIQDPSNLEPDKQVIVNIEKPDGNHVSIKTNHSLSDEQITWFKAGSALNYIKSH
ncbi:MAG: aconitate hydratase [Candidatus Actinomarina sp.]|jgi:aconitate hydratase|tara:strand:+ start:268 stop:2532 length:2265 start_codon:yes stop_codon:yes gene_type:complete